MDSITRIAYSDMGTATRTASIPIGEGDWEITQLNVIMGGSEPALNGVEIGAGTVAFEVLRGSTVVSKHFLLVGRCTRNIPMVMDCPKRVHGPGRIKSSLEHADSTEHTLSATYRRVRQ